MERTLTVLTPPDFSQAASLRETPGFLPEQVRFHPLWGKEPTTRAPMIIQGQFVSRGLGLREQYRACWLDSDLWLPEVSDDPAMNPRDLLRYPCPLADLRQCQPSFNSHGCLLELCAFDDNWRYIVSTSIFEPPPLRTPADPPWQSQCPPDRSAPRFAKSSRIESDPRSNLVGVYTLRDPSEPGPLRTLQLLSGASVVKDLPQALQAQDFQLSLLALGDLDQPLSTLPSMQTGDAVSLSADGTVQILLQRPDLFRLESDLSWQITRQLKTPSPAGEIDQAYRGTAIADLDGDGWQDVAILALAPDNRLRLLYASNLGAKQGFAELREVPLSGDLGVRFSQAGWALGDIDSDGDMDMVLFTQIEGTPSASTPLGLLAFVRNEAR